MSAKPRCRCGRRMAECWEFNSGTSRIAARCPEARPFKRNGHQWLVRTTPEHAATGCCDIRKVEG